MCVRAPVRGVLDRDSPAVYGKPSVRMLRGLVLVDYNTQGLELTTHTFQYLYNIIYLCSTLINNITVSLRVWDWADAVQHLMS